MKGWKTHEILAVAAIIMVLFGGVLVVREYTGFSTFLDVTAGTITELIIFKQFDADRWGGAFGLMLRLQGFNDSQFINVDTGEIVSSNPVFDCVPPNQEVELYASTQAASELDFATAQPAPYSMVNNLINASSNNAQSAENTYPNIMNITLGTTFITNISATHTFVNSAPQNLAFQTGILNISNHPVFVTKVLSLETNFRGGNSQYQILLAAANASQTYFFYADPFDSCPSGIGSSIAGFVDGFTLDEFGAILPNVTVWVGSSFNLTNETGYFNMTEAEGTYQIVGIKAGFQTYIAEISINRSFILRHNVTMTQVPNATSEVANATISGIAVDNATKIVLPNVTVTLFGQIENTDENGTYNISTIDGTHNLVAIKTGYQVYTASVNMPPDTETIHNISMIPLNGTLQGYVRESQFNLPLNGVSLTVGGRTMSSNASGFYTTTLRTGNFSIIATHTDYETFVGTVEIFPGITTEFNISLDEKNGVINGYVYDNETNATIQDVTVVIAGENTTTDSSGFYNLSVGAGERTIGAAKDGYLPFFDNITVVGSTTREYNITLQQFFTTENISNATGFGRISGTVVSSASAPLESVEVSAAGIHVFTDINGVYNFSLAAGAHNLIALLSGFDTHFAEVNITQGNETVHDITLIATTPSAVGPGVGPGEDVGPDVDSGPGEDEERPIVPLIQQPLEIIEFEISPDRILKKLREGTYVEIPIILNNYRKNIIRTTFEVEGEVAPLVQLDKDDLLVDAEGKGKLSIRIFASFPPGVYSGTLKIRGDAEKDIPIDVLVYSKDKLPIEVLLMKLQLGRKRVPIGGKLSYKLDMQNLLQEEEYRVFLFYSLFNLDTNETFFINDRDVIPIKSAETVIKQYRVGEDVIPGNYQLVVDAQYLNFTTTKKAYVRITLPLAQYRVFGVIPLWILALVLGGIFLIVGGILFYLHEQKKKRRYQIEVDYNAMPKAGPRSAYMGLLAETNKPVYFDIDLFQIHSLCAGSTGSGKSISAQVMIEEALMKGGSAIVFDPTAQWTGFLRKSTDPHFLGLYPKFGMKKTDARGFNGNIRQIMDAREKLDIVKYIRPGEITVFAINRLQPEDIDVLVSNTIQSVFKADLPESKTLRLLILFEEVHRLLPKFGGSGAGFRQIERGAREFRKWGVGLLLISQVLGDFAGEIKANINTEIQLRTRHEGDMKRIKDQYGEEVLKSVVKAQVGTGMVQNSNYNHGRPFFVSFRPLLHNTARLSEDELQNYNKFNDIIDDVEFQMEQLKELGQDVFDFQLELKLSKDKLKQGNFNMVNIYLEGLLPRLADVWKKLGKTPKKLVRELVSQDDLQEGMQAAVKARAEAESGAKEEEKPEEPKKEEPQDTPESALAKAVEAKKQAEAGEGEKEEKKEKPKEEKKEEAKEKGGEEKKPEKPPAPKEKEPAKPPEKPKQPEQEKAPASAPSPQNSGGEIDKLIAEANSALGKKDMALAKKLYIKVQSLYTKLPKDIKPNFLQKCLALRKSLT